MIANGEFVTRFRVALELLPARDLNFTEDQVEVLVHIGPEQTPNVLMVGRGEAERPKETTPCS